jgi:uncharacterized repeat protein (TIGR03803 family)
MTSTHSRSVSVAVATLAILTSVAGPLGTARAQTVFEVVQRFALAEVNPLTVGSDGNLYGTATGAAGETTAFRIDGTGTLTVLHTFAHYPFPKASRLILGRDGALYGTVKIAYTANWGGFFRIDNQGNYTLLSALPHSVRSDLILGDDGAFYAVFDLDSCVFGSCRGGNFFRIDSAGNLTLLTGDNPFAPPIPSVTGGDGALYGSKLAPWTAPSTTPAHIFRLDTASGNYEALHDLTADEGFPTDFVLGSDGLIYGAGRDSTESGYGNVFRFDSAGNFTVLRVFTGADGAYPIAPLTVGSDGAVYGVTEYDGPAAGGTVFRIDPAGTLTTLHAFDGVSGNPNQPLALGKDGALYGTTWSHTAFRIDNAGNFTSQPFDTTEDIISTVSPLVQSPADCAFYGVLAQPGPNFTTDQTVYRLFEPGHLCQRISFGPLPDHTLGDPPFTVDATASSGLPVSFSARGRCTLSGDQVRLRRGVGVCRVTAYQDGDARFAPAAQVTQKFRVSAPRSMRRLSW